MLSPTCSCYLFHFPSPCFSKLGLHLPYTVHSDKGKAQFFSEKEELEVTLMVKRPLDFINTCWQRIATSIQEEKSCSGNSVKMSCDTNCEVQRKELISLRSKLLSDFESIFVNWKQIKPHAWLWINYFKKLCTKSILNCIRSSGHFLGLASSAKAPGTEDRILWTFFIAISLDKHSVSLTPYLKVETLVSYEAAVA